MAFIFVKLFVFIGDWIGKQVQGFVFGGFRLYGLKFFVMLFVCQLWEIGKILVIDIGIVVVIKVGKIKVVFELKAFMLDGVIFEDGSEYCFIYVILAIGYYVCFEVFFLYSEFLFNVDYLFKSCIGEGLYKGFYFFGFDNYQFGGILGVVYWDLVCIVEVIQVWLMISSL